MKKLLGFFALLLLLGACGPDSEVEKPEEKGPLSITINNEVFNYYPTDFVVKSLYVGTPNIMLVGLHYAKSKSTANAWGITFSFVENKFTEASLTYVKEDGKVYRTADFNPQETFAIKNFTFDESTQKVSFEYDGKMYESLDVVNTSAKSITVKGKIETTISNKEGLADLPFAKFSANNYSFSTVKSISSRANDGSAFYMDFLSHDGYRLQLALDYAFQSSNFPLTYTFDVSDAVNNLSFYKFIGQPRAAAADIIRDEDWKKYSTKGTLTLNKIAPDHYEGTFSLEVYDGNALLHKTENESIVYTPNKKYPGI